MNSNYGIRSVLLVAVFIAPIVHGCSRSTSENPHNLPQLPDTYDRIVVEFNEAMLEYEAAERTAMTDEEVAEAERRFPNRHVFSKRMMGIAERPDTDPQTKRHALAWVVKNQPGFGEGIRALELLQANHLSEDLSPVCESLLSATESEQVRQFLQAVLDDCPVGNAKGIACYALAKQLQLLGLRAEWFQTNEEPDATTDEMDRMLSVNLELNRIQVKSLFERVESEYSDIQVGDSQTLSTLCEPELFEIRNLSVGRQAPEIEGQDIDGAIFRLSDLRGNVVFLDFWGNW